MVGLALARTSFTLGGLAHQLQHLVEADGLLMAIHDVSSVGHALDERPAESRGRDHARPLAEGQVGGNENARILMLCRTWSLLIKSYCLTLVIPVSQPLVVSTSTVLGRWPG